MTIVKLECVNCGWLGKPDDRQRQPCQEPGLENAVDMICPHCAGVDFYEVKVPADKRGGDDE